MNIYEKLLIAQTSMKVPKSNYNEFGKYSYRNCEDILEAFKPVGESIKAMVIVRDELIHLGDRYYVKAIATFVDVETEAMIVNEAYARETDSKSGMDASQITGAASSYARKYALNGLFCIDDNKDADSSNNDPKPNKQAKKNNERDELIQKFETEIIRTGANRSWFLNDAKATEPKYFKTEKLKEYIEKMGKYPDKEQI